MRSFRVMPAALFLLAGCACEPMPTPPLPPPQPASAAPETGAPVVTATPAATVKRLYQDTERKEVPAILKADATVLFIRRIRIAHGNAERAVHKLEQEGSHARAKTLATASAAVRALQDAVDAPPDATQ